MKKSLSLNDICHCEIIDFEERVFRGRLQNRPFGKPMNFSNVKELEATDGSVGEN